jgi:hypothetical protein
MAAQQNSPLTWSTRQLSDSTSSIGQVAIAADQTGVVHVFWDQRNPDDTQSLFYGRNEGDSWTINDIRVGDVHVPRAQVDGNGLLHLLWTDGQSSDLMHSSASAGAAALIPSWSPPVTVAEGPLFDTDFAIDAHETLHAVGTSIRNDAPSVQYFRSIDGGETWSRLAQFSTSDRDLQPDRPRLAVAQDGTLHLVWGVIPRMGLYGGLGVYYSHSQDGGNTWSAPARLDPVDLKGKELGAWQASIIAIGDSDVHIVWNAHSLAGRRFHQLSRDGGLTWSHAEPVLGTLVSQTGPNPMIADGSGTLYLISAGTPVWGQRQGVYIAPWNGSQWLDPQLVDTASDEPHWLRTAVSTGNTLHLVWQARTQEPPGAWYTSATTFGAYLTPRPYPLLTRALVPRADAQSLTTGAHRSGASELPSRQDVGPEPQRPVDSASVLVDGSNQVLLLPILTAAIVVTGVVVVRLRATGLR